ncbi:NAD(P)H-binding protein [Oceanobacter mangrovi]|uniref:NmrA family NAD(P)-binding protein n=1 Tax=Oceanobacter mangrovi TaxID=2862510 RepID=UPI001C8EB2BC|nr:NAD(P)H-binding protein [Oceanobacter mangrovi]
MILVTGVTGQLGFATINELNKHVPSNGIAALARSQNDKTNDLSDRGIDIRFGSYNDYESLVSAFQGIDKLLFISSGEAFADFTLHENVIKAAQTANVKQVIYTSTQRSTAIDESCLSEDLHGWTEYALKKSGLNYVILRNSPYMESIPQILGQGVLESGYHAPVGEGKISFATRTDMALATANVLCSQGHDFKTYDLGGIESVSFGEIIDEISKVTGKDIPFSSPETDDYIKSLTSDSFPEAAIQALVGFANQVNSGYFDNPSNDLASLIGRNPVSVSEFLKQTFAD